MTETSIVPSPEAPGTIDRLFGGLVQCLHCAARRVVDIRRGDFLVLRRDGTIYADCPQCGGSTPHRLVRITS